MASLHVPSGQRGGEHQTPDPGRRASAGTHAGASDRKDCCCGREPYPVNVPAVIDACAATGTWIESELQTRGRFDFGLAALALRPQQGGAMHHGSDMSIGMSRRGICPPGGGPGPERLVGKAAGDQSSAAGGVANGIAAETGLLRRICPAKNGWIWPDKMGLKVKFSF